MASVTHILGPTGFRPRPTTSPWLEHALAYASIGWPVFPVIGKAPLPKSGGAYDGTTEPRTLQHLFAHPGITGLALSCGFTCALGHHLEVVDVDPRNGGDVTLEMLTARHGELPETVYQRSGGGGSHYLFAVPDGRRIRPLGKGIDIKRRGGYIVLAPSIHPDGGVYDMPLESSPFEGCPVAQAPAWMTEDAAEIVKLQLSGRGYLPPARVQEIRLALDHLDADDYHQWVRVGQALHSTEAEEAFDVWREWSERSPKYRPGVCERKWRTFRAGGGLNVESIFHMAREAGADPSRLKAGGTQALASAGGEQDSSEPRKRLIEWIDGDGDLKVEPLDFVVEDFLVAKTLSLLWGADGTGKSFIVQDMALSVGTGRPWHGRDVKQGSVLYIAGEGHPDLPLRIKAWREFHEVEGAINFHYTSAGTDLQDQAFIDEIMEMVAEVEASGRPPVTLIIVDTLSTNFGPGSENSDEHARPFARNLLNLATDTGAHVLVVHHSGKDSGKGARGSSLLQGEAYTKLEVVRPQDGVSRLLCHKMKGAPAPKPIQFRFEPVDLGSMVNHKGQMQPVNSAVPVVDIDANEGADLADALLSNHLSKKPSLGTNQRTVLQILTNFESTYRANNPSIERPVVTRKDLYDAMKKAGISETKTTHYAKEAIAFGWLVEINPISFEITLTA